MAQTEIRDSRSGAFAGQIAEEMQPQHRRTGIVADGKSVTPGQVVILAGSEGPNGEDVVRDIENGDTIDATTVGGVVKLDTFRENISGAGYGEKKTVTLIREGVVYMKVTADVSNRNEVYVGNTTATLGQIAGATGTGLVAYPGARFLDAGSTGDLVRVHIRTDV